MPHGCEGARPVVRSSTRLDTDNRGAEAAHERHHLSPTQSAAQNRLLGSVHTMKLKHALRGIHSNAHNLFHDDVSW
jgi:hypothetical protein